jgi:hypothetical protein
MILPDQDIMAMSIVRRNPGWHERLIRIRPTIGVFNAARTTGYGCRGLSYHRLIE